MPWWAWITLGAGLLAAEIIISTDFYLVFFGVSGLVMGLLLAFGVPLPTAAQWLIYVALSALALVVYRQKIRSRFMSTAQELSPELVDEIGVAKEAILAGGRGTVELRGTVWDARNEGEEDLAEGGRCVVMSVDGLSLVVRAQD